MRSRSRDRQKIWFVTVTEKKVGIDTIYVYNDPVIEKKMSVSSGSVKKCVQDTNFSPEEYPQAWEDA